MQNRDAFTMIELIFVIVMIAILGAIAIPRMAATRDDAVTATIAANTKICIKDIVALYTATARPALLSRSEACIFVNELFPGSIILRDANIVVSGINNALNGNHRYKGTSVER